MLVFIHHPEPELKRCHFEPQLKECHMFSLHPESQLKGYHFEPRLKECSSKVHLKVSPKAPKTTNIHTQAAPGGNQLQTAWQKPQAAKRHTL